MRGPRSALDQRGGSDQEGGRGHSLGKRLSGLLRKAMDLWRAYHRTEASDFGAQAEGLKRELSYNLRDRPMADADNYQRNQDAGSGWWLTACGRLALRCVQRRSRPHPLFLNASTAHTTLR